MQRGRGLTILACMKKTAGFTIIELMITIAVLGIALAIAVPNMQQFILNNRLTSQLNLLGSSLAMARSEAIKENQVAVVCVTTDGAQCDDSGADWNNGWLVFIDRNADMDVDGGDVGCAEEAPEDCILLAENSFPGVNTLRAAGDVADLIAYDGSGSARCDDNADGVLEDCDSADTYFVLCDQRGATHARAIAISKTGRASILDKAPNGDALTCTP